MPSLSDRTVVLLHSSASSARQWEDLVEALHPGFRVRTIEFHGHGAQPAWHGNSALTLADDAALVEPLLAEAGGAHVVGHSYGAAIALKLATTRPQLVRSLVAYEPVMFRLLIDDPASDRLAQAVVALGDSIRDRLRDDQPHSAAQRFVEFWSGSGAWAALPGARQQAIAARMRCVHRHFEALFHEPLQRTRMARLGMPMLVLTGAGTVATTRRIAALLRLALPLARHEVLAAMGHMGPITHAAQVNRCIVAFLHARALAEPVPALASSP